MRKSLYEDGREWLLRQDWVSMDKIQKLWYGSQVERFIRKFGLDDDSAKKLKFEIAERGRR